MEIKGVLCTELFTVKEDYMMDNIINMLNKLIDNNPLKSIEEKNNKIKELESNLELEKLKEITKLELKLKLKNKSVNCIFITNNKSITDNSLFLYFS